MGREEEDEEDEEGWEMRMRRAGRDLVNPHERARERVVYDDATRMDYDSGQHNSGTHRRP
jgi:hypothetical protein